MDNKKESKYSNYLNNVRRGLSRRLRPNVGININLFPSIDGGAVIEILFMHNKKNKDTISKHEYSTTSQALKNVKQNAFAGDLNNYKFSGTNAIMDGNKIILIKDGSESEWGVEAANKDVNNIFGVSK
ncbi:TPA: hypothetical protein ACSTNG_001718 [Serratia fonticola]